jgi:hypothetical protein
MGIKRLQGTLLLSLLVSGAAGASADAAEISGRSSTSFQWFDNQLNNNRTQVELGEYLRISVTNIDKEGKFSLQGYGRGTQDFTTGEGLNGRLYYLYGEYRNLFDKADIRVGRQFVNMAAGNAIIDGAQVDLKNIGPVGFSVMGGHEVVYGLNGDVGNGGKAAMGVSAYLVGFKQTDLELGWFRKTDESDITRDVLGVNFKQYLLSNVKLYGNAKFDLVSESFNEVLAGVKYYPTANLIFTGEYYQSYATFDANSIYAVFAVNRYREGVARAEYTLNDKLSLNAGYTREEFGDDGSANVYHIGAGYRPFDPLKINLELDKRQGYYGSVDGFIVDAAYDLNKTVQLAGGINFDSYQRDALTGDEIARRYWLGGKCKLAKNMAVSGRIQDDVNVTYSKNISGRLVFDYDF